jgi:soluble lytic murein transglycosylase-like protein
LIVLPLAFLAFTAAAVPPELVLSVLCRHWPAPLPGQIERAARRARAPSDLLAATVGAESTCDNKRVSRKGAIGYGQILPGGNAAKGKSAIQLRRVSTNLRLAAEHLARCLRLCHGAAVEAVAVYSGVSTCQETVWSRHVVGAIEQARQR